MNIKQVKEQMQEDILTILEGFGVDESLEGADYNKLVTELCDVVITGLNNIKDPKLYTEDEMRQAHSFGALYTKGSIAEAQEYRIEKLLRT